MGSFEVNYDEDSLRTFTEKERTQLRSLHKRFDKKFAEITAFLTKELGWQTNDPRAAEEAEDAIDRWEEDVVPPQPTTPLEHLLAEHHEIEEQIISRQYGVPIDVVRHAVTRNGDGTPSSIIGAVLERLAQSK